MAEKITIHDFLNNWQFLDNYPIENSENTYLIEAIKLYNQGDYQLGYEKLVPYKKTNLLVNFYLLLSLSQCQLTPESQLQVAQLLVDLYNSEKINPALWFAAQILAIHNPMQAQNMMAKILKTPNFPLNFLNKLVKNLQSFNIINNILIGYKSSTLMTTFDNNDTARINKINAPSDILGNPEKNITEFQSQYIDWFLSNQWLKFKRNHYIQPKFINYYNKHPLPSANKPQFPRILFMGWQYFLGDERDKLYYSTEKWVNNFIEMGYILGDNFQIYFTDKIAISHIALLQKYYHGRCKFLDGKPYITNAETKIHELKLLHEKIAEFKPDIILFDQNNTVYDGEDTISAQDFMEIKQKFSCKIIRHLSDYHDFTPNVPNEWLNAIDLFSSSLMPISHHKRNIPDDKIIQIPAFPSPLPNYPKIINFGFAGNVGADREAYLHDTDKFIANSKIFKGQAFPNMTDYNNYYASCKMTFNTGYRGMMNNNDYFILTSRPFESISNRILLFEEDGGACSEFFVPWRDFIPVKNRAEMIIYAQFFSENHEWWQRITDQAFNIWQENYDFPLIWQTICARLECKS